MSGLFVDHHVRLGVKHFFILDNGSTDSTVEQFRRSDRVTLFESGLSFHRWERPFREFLRAPRHQNRVLGAGSSMWTSSSIFPAPNSWACAD